MRVQFPPRDPSRGRLAEGCLATNQETAGSNPALEAIAPCRGSSTGRAPASEAGGWRFEPAPRRHAAAARSDERPGPNGKAAGSSPAGGSISAVAARSDERRASTPTVGGSSPPCGAITFLLTTNPLQDPMFLRIPLPRGVAPGDLARLRTHAAWYRRQVERFGSGYGARRRARSIRRSSLPTTSRSGPVL